MDTPDYFANVTGAIEGLREAAELFLDSGDAANPAEALALAFDNLADDVREDDEPPLTFDQVTALRVACGIDAILDQAAPAAPAPKLTAISPERLVELRAQATTLVSRFPQPSVINRCCQVLDRRGEAWAAEVLGRDLSRRSLASAKWPFLNDADPYTLIAADIEEDRARFDQITRGQ
jgi:hypothetical protein